MISKMPPYDWSQAGVDQSGLPDSMDGPNADKIHEVRDLVTLEDKSLYEGEWDRVNNVIDGRGIKIWPDGTRYDGTWLQG